MKSRFKCQQHGIVEPKQVPEKVLEFKNSRMTIVRMECPLCGCRLIREDPKWQELRELMGK